MAFLVPRYHLLISMIFTSQFMMLLPMMVTILTLSTPFSLHL
jgi:hypothetical protein